MPSKRKIDATNEESEPVRKKKLTKAEKEALQRKVKLEFQIKAATKAKTSPEASRPTKRRRTTPAATPTRKTPTRKTKTSTSASSATKPKAAKSKTPASQTKKTTRKKQLAEARARAADWRVQQEAKAASGKKKAPVQEDEDVISEEEEEEEEDSELDSEQGGVIEEEESEEEEEEENVFEHVLQPPVAKKSASSSRRRTQQKRRNAQSAAGEWVKSLPGYNEQNHLPSPPREVFARMPSVQSPPDAAAGMARQRADVQPPAQYPPVASMAPLDPRAWPHASWAAHPSSMISPLAHQHIAHHAPSIDQQASTLQGLLSSPDLGPVLERVKQQQREAEESQKRLDQQVRDAAGSNQQVTTENKPNVVVDEEEEEASEVSLAQTIRKTAATILFFACFVFVAAVMMALVLSDSDSSEPSAGVTHKQAPPCLESTTGYEDTNVEPPQWLVEKGIDACVPTSRNKAPLPCPAGGLCSGGFLLGCHESRFLEPNEWGTSCVLTSDAAERISAIKDILTNLTVDYHCGLGCQYAGSCNVAPQSVNGTLLSHFSMFAVPMFAVDDIKNALGQDVDKALVALANSTIQAQYDSNGTFLIGLTDDSKLPIPFSCMSYHLLIGLVSVAWRVLVTLATVASNVMYAAPITSLVVVFSFSFASHMRNARIQREELHKTVAEVRELAFSKLQCYDQPMSILMLRDEVAHELHPYSEQDRHFIITKVWKLVVADAKRDNRISKSVQMTKAGNPREFWRWAAPKTPVQETNKKDN